MDRSWDDKVTVVLHHVPENEEYEGGYEAVAMTGVPYNVIVTGGDRDSSEMALSHLLDGLRAFGFVGRVVVDDATAIGPATALTRFRPAGRICAVPWNPWTRKTSRSTFCATRLS